MRNFDSWCAEHIDNTMANTKRLLSALNEWENMLGRHIMEPKETEQDRVQFVKFLRDTEKKIEEINRDLYRADQNFVTAIESGSKPSYAYESKNRSKKRRIKESVSGENIDGYAVQIQDMGKGYIHLVLFDSIEDAESAYKILKFVELFADDGGYASDEYYYSGIEEALCYADEIVNEVDWRREIDKDDVWTASDDTRYQIVGEVPLYVYW